MRVGIEIPAVPAQFTVKKTVNQSPGGAPP